MVPILVGPILVGPELLEPWRGRTWGQSHFSGLQKWLQGFQLRWHSSCHSQLGMGQLSPFFVDDRTRSPFPVAPLSKDVPPFEHCLSEKGSWYIIK